MMSGSVETEPSKRTKKINLFMSSLCRCMREDEPSKRKIKKIKNKKFKKYLF